MTVIKTGPPPAPLRPQLDMPAEGRCGPRRSCAFHFLEGSPFDHNVCKRAGVGRCDAVIIGACRTPEQRASTLGRMRAPVTVWMGCCVGAMAKLCVASWRQLRESCAIGKDRAPLVLTPTPPPDPCHSPPPRNRHARVHRQQQQGRRRAHAVLAAGGPGPRLGSRGAAPGPAAPRGGCHS